MSPSSCMPLTPENEHWIDEDLRASCSVDIDVKISINIGSIAVTTSELVGKTMKNKRSLDHFLENSSEIDCILMGDYFELNDLVDQGSCSSGSSDSSCLTTNSEEYFDSIALLKELEDDIMDQEMKDSSVESNEVLHTTTSVTLRSNKERKRSAKEVFKVKNRKESTSNGVDIKPYSSSCDNTSKEGKDLVSWTKRPKMIKDLCLLAF